MKYFILKNAIADFLSETERNKNKQLTKSSLSYVYRGQ